MESKEFDNGLTIVFWNKGSKELGIAQASLENPNRFLVGKTTRQFDYECGWRPNKEWTTTLKCHLDKETAIQKAKELISSKNKMKESMTKTLASNGQRSKAVDFASLIFSVVKEAYDKEDKVYDCNQYTAEVKEGYKYIGPNVWFAVMGLSGTRYDFYINCTWDETYSMTVCIKDNADPLVEWVGKSLEEFIIDFEEAVSLDWT